MTAPFDVAIAGGGVAGLTAGLTAARLGRRTLVLTGGVLGGHLLSIERVDGFPGFPEGVPGYELCPMVQEQAAAAGAVLAADEVQEVEPYEDGWRLVTTGEAYETRAVIAATGTALKTLGLPGEDRLRGKGVSQCASCDAPLLRDRMVAVVGGGDSAMQESLTLAQSAARVVVLHRGEALSAQAAYREPALAHPRIEVRFRTTVEEIVGEDVLTGVRTREAGSGAADALEVAGLFVYIGLRPNAACLGSRLRLDPSGAVPVDGWMRTEAPGVFAAGTVRSGSTGRAAAAAGDGAAAAVAADRYLRDGAWQGRVEWLRC